MNKVPKIIPYRKGRVHQNVSVRSTDGFKFFSIASGPNIDSHLRLAKLIGEYDREFSACESARSTGVGLFGTDVPWSLPNQARLLRAYFYSNTASSFAIISFYNRIVCGFRHRKDYFRYSLKFGTEPVRSWDSGWPFWVFIDDNDTQSFLALKATEWNISDPMTGWLRD